LASRLLGSAFFAFASRQLIATVFIMSRVGGTTYSGYAGAPQGARVIQGATTFGSAGLTGTTTYSGATAYAGAGALGSVRSVGTPIMQSSVASARPIQSMGTVGTVGTVSMAGARPGVAQARVLSSPQVTQGGYQMAAPTTFASQPRVVSGGYTSLAAPQLLQSGVRPAKVLSGGVVTQPNTVAGPSYTQSAYEVKHKDDPQLQNLKELRKTCGLKAVPVNDALQTFKSTAIDGRLTRDQFLIAYGALLGQFQIDVPADEVTNAVFDLFDRDDNGVVDMMELICGASLLCTGSEEDKIHAVFNVFDENGDGVISMDEMFKFLTSVFKVVLTPNVMAVMNSMGVTVESPEDLASVTALECFKTADLNHDGRLSVSEFKNWFFAPRNDPSFLFSPVRKLLQ